jgi:hypothetical protein
MTARQMQKEFEQASAYIDEVASNEIRLFQMILISFCKKLNILILMLD